MVVSFYRKDDIGRATIDLALRLAEAGLAGGKQPADMAKLCSNQAVVDMALFLWEKRIGRWDGL